MKRLIILLLLCAVVLTGCASVGRSPFVETTPIPLTDTVFPEAEELPGTAAPQSESAVLYFRYLDEPLLAGEARVIRQLPSQSFELALLGELISGPGTHAVDLKSLFPVGTHVLSTVKSGRTLFVTLSQEIMNPYADEPVDWQEKDEWRREVPLRRQLCMQSIVATVTENCDVDQVQILVQQTGVTGSLRLKQNYFMDDSEDDVLVGPMTRDPGMLLSAETVLQVALGCWQRQDWARLYLYMASRDRLLGTERPIYRDFVSIMETLPRVTAFTPNGITLAADGMTRTLKDRMLHMCRENGLWKVSLAQLTGWLEEGLM